MRETEKAKPTTSQNQKPKKNPQLQRSGKKPNSKIALKPKPSTGWGLTSGCCRSVDSTSALSVNDFKHKKKMMVDDVDESGETTPNPLILSDFTTGFVENTSTTTPVCKLAACVPVLGCEFEFEFDDKLMKDDSTAIAIAATATTTTTTTPPVEASVSPEIQCGSSLLVSSATPACYGAGHIISGVTDGRKCRARGLLTVGKNDSNFGKSNISNNADDDIEIPSKSRMSLAPLPVEASVHWLLSPCHDEDGDHETDTENGLQPLRKSVGFASVSSPLSSGHRISSDLCNIFYSGSTTSGSSKRKTRVTLLSPSGNPALSVSPHATPTSEAIISQEQRKPRYDLSGENSPFSIESLGSGNVIQTPQSDLSSDRCVGLFWLNEHDHQKNDFGSERDSVAGIASLSPKNQTSIWDPLGLSFQFSDLISPSNSIDFSQVPNARDNHASCISISTLEDISCSQMRISWRDGLVSRIFEMDEFNCCGCLSDDENDVRECGNGKSKSSPSHDLNIDVGNAAILSNGFGFPEVVGHESKSDKEGKQKFHMQRSNPCAESICIEGGGLVASGDSDWTVCYKNQLFQL